MSHQQQQQHSGIKDNDYLTENYQRRPQTFEPWFTLSLLKSTKSSFVVDNHGNSCAHTVSMPLDDDDDDDDYLVTAAATDVLPVLVSLSEISNVVNNEQVTASTCRWHVLLLMQPLLVILVSAVLQHTTSLRNVSSWLFREHCFFLATKQWLKLPHISHTDS